MNRRSPWAAWLLVCVAPLACSEATEDSVNSSVDLLERQLEMRHHEDLLRRIARTGSTLAPFTTDGCSGGLSVGWSYLTEQVAALKQSFGVRPPWEHCCVDHDRLYHAAVPADTAAADSFQARKQADLALLACVESTAPATSGIDDALSAEALQTLYNSVAELMYRAVRVGGMPCSGLPWRWGYGWPECD